MDKSYCVNFLRDFSRDIFKEHKGVSFFVYGSIMRDDFSPKGSDIDGFFVFDNDFITDKGVLMDISKTLNFHVRRKGFNLENEFVILDKGTCSDVRFLVYSKDYVDFLKENSYKVFGDFNLDSLKGFEYKHSQLGSVAWNLDGMRKGFLNYSLNKSQNNDYILNQTLKEPIKKLASLPKQLINLGFGKLIQSKRRALDLFLDTFPDYDGGFANKNFESLYGPSSYNPFNNSEKDLEYSLRCLTEYEKMIKCYVEKFPNASSREVRD